MNNASFQSAITLSYALMTHNEVVEFGWLIEALKDALNEQSEIVVLDDFSTSDMVELIKRYALNKNFSAQRNVLKGLCRGEFVFLLDPDELPSPELLKALPRLMEVMRQQKLDAISMPRLNILVEGDAPVDARTRPVSDTDLRNQKPDYMTRLLRNDPEIKWVNRVHERLVGVRRGGRLPNEVRYALLHCKTQSRYENQNRFYRSINLRYLDKWRKSIAKRLKLIKPTVWVDIKP
jgi:glycosyltransferase involved in cell wall biosynthesis